MADKYKVYQEPISWTTKGTYKNIERVINKIPKSEEFVQIDYSITHLHLITRLIPDRKKHKKYKYKIYDEPIFFTQKGTYSNLLKAINKLPKSEKFIQVCTTPTHLHMVTKKEMR
jgi:hypothetical protein